MLKDFAWNSFMKIGILDSYIFYREMEEREGDRAEEQQELAQAEAAPSQA